MKKFLEKIKLFSNNLFTNFNREKLENLIPYLVPEFWASNRKSFLLFWFIGIFTIFFIIWASFAEVNQVVRAQGTVVPDSKVHLVQSGISGPIQKINIKLDDRVVKGDILYLVDQANTQKFYDLAKKEYETRLRKVEILRNLVSSGSDSEFRLLDEELLLVDAEGRYNSAKKNLEFSTVRAPISGSISNQNVTNIGQLVSSGDLLSEIVPKDDFLKIEAFINPKDIAYVRQGHKAKIAFSAYDLAIYGQFEGIVTKVAANTTSNQEGETYYPAIIELNYDDIKNSDREVILQSGMISDVSIIGEERTVISYVLNPITKLSKTALQE